MKFEAKVVLICVMGGVLAVWLTETNAEEVAQLPKDVEAQLPQLDLADCKKVMARLAKRILKSFGRCTKELKANTTGNKEEFEKRLGCAVKCTMNGLKLLDENGRPSRERNQAFMEGVVPQEAHEFAHALTQDCNDNYGSQLDPNQEYCESYSAYASCLQNTIADFADKTNCHPGGMNG